MGQSADATRATRRRLAGQSLVCRGERVLAGVVSSGIAGTTATDLPSMVRQLVKMNFDMHLEYHKTVMEEGEEDAQR